VPTTDSDDVDKLFREAVSTIDAGEIGALERLIAEYPLLVSVRLESNHLAPGSASASARPWMDFLVGLSSFGSSRRIPSGMVGSPQTLPRSSESSRARPGSRAYPRFRSNSIPPCASCAGPALRHDSGSNSR
jgi:hypothetical protein